MAWQVKGMGGHATNLPNADNPFAAQGGDAGVSAVFDHDFRYAVNGCFSHTLPGRLPAVTFLTMSFVAFATASFWGIFAVAIPIVLPLADAVGAEMPLVIGALISASAFGSHACFYGDSTVLAARGAGCGVVEHALTQLPYALFAAALAAGGFLVLA